MQIVEISQRKEAANPTFRKILNLAKAVRMQRKMFQAGPKKSGTPTKIRDKNLGHPSISWYEDAR
jgi:hypothetical protein